jgi:hypothetical protein
MTGVELALAEALDREWAAQSARTGPLEPTVPVRTALELVLAGTPAGIFGAARVGGATPDEVVAALRDDLPEALSPWAMRSLARVGALRFTLPRLEPGEDVRALPAREPIPIGPADIPQLPAPETEPELVLERRTPTEPAPDAPRRRTRTARLGAAVVAAPIGAGIAVAGAASDLGVLAAAAGAAVVAAGLARILGGRR